MFGSGTKLVQELEIAINNTVTGNIKAMRRDVRNIDSACNAASGGKVPKYSNEGLRNITNFILFLQPHLTEQSRVDLTSETFYGLLVRARNALVSY